MFEQNLSTNRQKMNFDPENAPFTNFVLTQKNALS